MMLLQKSLAAFSFNPELRNISDPKMVVWAGYGEEIAEQPAMAMEIIADNGEATTPDYQKWLLLVDARTGSVLYSENMILNVDVEGNVSGMGTPGAAADICLEETTMVIIMVDDDL